MGIIELVITLAVFGVILWLIQTYVPMPAPIKVVIQVLIVLACIVVLLKFAGFAVPLAL